MNDYENISEIQHDSNIIQVVKNTHRFKTKSDGFSLKIVKINNKAESVPGKLFIARCVGSLMRNLLHYKAIVNIFINNNNY